MNASWGTITASTCNLSIGHQGLIQDVESGLVYVRNRYFHPNCGTWVRREPSGARYIDSSNLYEYVDSDPINLDDPFGLDSGGHWVDVPGTKGHQQRWVPNPPKPPTPPPTPPTSSPTSCPTTCPAPNPAANIANGIGNLIGGLWDLPNNIVGGVLAGLGQASGGKSAPHNGIIETTGVPWMQGGLTVGNYTIYGPPSGPNDQGFGPTTPLDNGPARDHEHQHSCQSQMLGPFYLPANVLGGLLGILSNPFGPDPWHGPGNFMENGPESNPPRPF
jgi:RHS repeat-associated protein